MNGDKDSERENGINGVMISRLGQWLVVESLPWHEAAVTKADPRGFLVSLHKATNWFDLCEENKIYIQ